MNLKTWVSRGINERAGTILGDGHVHLTLLSNYQHKINDWVSSPAATGLTTEHTLSALTKAAASGGGTQRAVVIGEIRNSGSYTRGRYIFNETCKVNVT